MPKQARKPLYWTAIFLLHLLLRQLLLTQVFLLWHLHCQGSSNTKYIYIFLFLLEYLVEYLNTPSIVPEVYLPIVLSYYL